MIKNTLPSHWKAPTDPIDAAPRADASPTFVMALGRLAQVSHPCEHCDADAGLLTASNHDLMVVPRGRGGSRVSVAVGYVSERGSTCFAF